MAHFDEAQRDKLKAVSKNIGSVRKVDVLEKMIEEQDKILEIAEFEINDLYPCYERYKRAIDVRWNCRKMLRKMKRKFENISKVKAPEWKLQVWYKLNHEYATRTETYVFPERVSPAGLAFCLEVTHNPNVPQCGPKPYSGPVWSCTRDWVQSRTLDRASRLTILVTMGNLDRIRQACADLADYEYRQFKDTGDPANLEVL